MRYRQGLWIVSDQAAIFRLSSLASALTLR